MAWNERAKALHFASGAAERDYKYEKYNNQPVIWHVTAISLGRGGGGGNSFDYYFNIYHSMESNAKEILLASEYSSSCSRASTTARAARELVQLELLSSEYSSSCLRASSTPAAREQVQLQLLTS